MNKKSQTFRLSLLVFGLVLIKLLISIPFLGTNPIDLDEPFSIFHAQKDLSDLLSIFKTENNPPLHFVLLHFWQDAFGISPVSVRSLSLLFSVLTIPVLWRIGIRFFNLRSAVILCLLFIFSDYHYYHGIEARTYSLLIFEYSILLYFLFRILFSQEKTRLSDYLAIGILNAVLFYTHYIFPFILFSEFVLLLLFIKKIEWKKLLITSIVFCVLVLPWVNILLTRVDSVNAGGTWLAQAQYSELYGLLNKFFNDRWSFLALVLVVGSILVLRWKNVFGFITEKKNVILFLSILFALPYLGAFILSKFGGIELFLDRYLFFLTLPLFMLIALFFGQKDKLYQSGFILFFAVYLLKFDIPATNHRDGDQLAEYVKNSGINTIVIAPDYYDLTFNYHYNQALFKDVKMRDNEIEAGIYPLKNEQVLGLISQKEEVVFIDADYSFTHPNDSILKWFESSYTLTEKRLFKGNYTVYFFSKMNE